MVADLLWSVMGVDKGVGVGVWISIDVLSKGMQNEWNLEVRVDF